MLGDIPSLDGCEAKFGRGKTHAKKLRTEIASILNDDSYRLRPERDEQTAQYVFYAEELPTVREDWGLVFGDAIHNLRATLDHLVVQLAILGQGRALTEEEVRSSEFPVLHDPASWGQVAGPRGVKLLRSGERERIRELQPFNAQDRSIWGRAALFGAGARIPRMIQALHHIDIADKHRFVYPSWYAVGTVSLPPLEGVRSAMTDGNRLERGAEVGRWGFDRPPPDLPADLKPESYFPLEVAFTEPSGRLYSVLEFMDEMEPIIGALIELFRPPITNSDPVPAVTTLL
jgi:hypothetical protein